MKELKKEGIIQELEKLKNILKDTWKDNQPLKNPIEHYEQLREGYLNILKDRGMKLEGTYFGLFGLTYSDFHRILFDGLHSFIELQKIITVLYLKYLKDSSTESFQELAGGIDKILTDYRDKNLTYNIYLFYNTLKSLTIISLKNKKDVDTMLEWKRASDTKWVEKLLSNEPQSKFIREIKKIKKELLDESGGIKKVKKSDIQKEMFKRFGLKKTKFYEQTKKIDLDSL